MVYADHVDAIRENFAGKLIAFHHDNNHILLPKTPANKSLMHHDNLVGECGNMAEPSEKMMFLAFFSLF